MTLIATILIIAYFPQILGFTLWLINAIFGIVASILD